MEENIFKKNTGGNWDRIWQQKGIIKQLSFLKKISFFYISITGLLSKFLKKYKKNEKCSFFEIGCGGSSYFPYLEKKYSNFRLFGLDKSFTACKLAIEGLNKNCSQLDVICGDIMKYPLKSDRFDIVFSLGLIEHFEDPYLVLKKHFELLKPGGLLICYIPNVVGLQGNFFRFFESNIMKERNTLLEDPKKWIWGMKIITVEELTNWLNNLGLNEIKVCPIGGIYPLLMMESYYVSDSNLLSVKLINLLYRYLVSVLLIAINIPLFFRVNTKTFSPLFVAVGVKQHER